VQIEKVLYTANTHTTGGREGGASRTFDGRLDVKLTVPGTKGDGTNPEQLFAVGWPSCFLSVIKLAAARMKVKLPPDVVVDAEVDIGTTDGRFTGVSGTTAFFNRILFEKLEAGKARVVGYTSWPNLTYTVP
jgi:Ohr subfamily peroxiredoxin